MPLFLRAFFLFPLDFVRFTVDIHRLAWRRGIYYFLHKYEDQPCFYCQGADTGRCPRPPPPGYRRYCNRWLIQPWLPCIRHPRNSQAQANEPTKRLCFGEGGYLHISGWVIPAALLTSLVWVLLLGLATVVLLK